MMRGNAIFPQLNEDVAKNISKSKNEPKWLLDFRLQALKVLANMQMPPWMPDISRYIDLTVVKFYKKPNIKKSNSWEDIPSDVRSMYDKLGIPEAEKKHLAGVTAQQESELIYENLKEKYQNLGIIFTDISIAAIKYPSIVKKYLGKLVMPSNNIFAALNAACFSGGTLIYIPEGTIVPYPLQSYFMINMPNVGQFERTLIIAEEGSWMHYIEGCGAPLYSSNTLHAGVVEVFVGKNASVEYTTIQNWSKNVLNLTTKKALVNENGQLKWTDCNIGSAVTMKYPACVLAGKNAKASLLSLSYVQDNQIQDTGGKMIHMAQNTTSTILSKSIVKGKGVSTFRGQVIIKPKADNSVAKSDCSTLIMDKEAEINSYPDIRCYNDNSSTNHEASVSVLDSKRLYYLATRGINKAQAQSLVVNGFMNDILSNIPMEYAVEVSKLIQMDLENESD